MSEKSFESSNNSLEASVMPIAAEMRSIVLEAAEPADPGERINALILRASRRLQLGYSRTRAYFYQQVRLVPAQEADRLRAVRQAMRRERLARLDAEAALIRAQLKGIS